MLIIAEADISKTQPNRQGPGIQVSHAGDRNSGFQPSSATCQMLTEWSYIKSSVDGAGLVTLHASTHKLAQLLDAPLDLAPCQHGWEKRWGCLKSPWVPILMGDTRVESQNVASAWLRPGHFGSEPMGRWSLPKTVTLPFKFKKS